VLHLGQARGEHHDQADLGELRGGDLEPRDVEPALSARGGRAQERDPDQQQRDDDPGVEEPGVDLQEPVVEGRHHQDEHDTDRRRHHLLVDAQERIEPVLSQGLVGRRVQEEEAHDDQDRGHQQQEAVDVADRPALVRVHAPRDEIHQSSASPSCGPEHGVR
jgi:hypothetical protein